MNFDEILYVSRICAEKKIDNFLFLFDEDQHRLNFASQLSKIAYALAVVYTL